jgi:hypothetical protein
MPRSAIRPNIRNFPFHTEIQVIEGQYGAGRIENMPTINRMQAFI